MIGKALAIATKINKLFQKIRKKIIDIMVNISGGAAS